MAVKQGKGNAQNETPRQGAEMGSHGKGHFFTPDPLYSGAENR